MPMKRKRDKRGATKEFLKVLNATPLRKPKDQFKINDLVIHVNHGKGKVIALSEDTSSIIVEFDKEPEGWDKILEVSVACLSKEEIK